LDTWSLGLDGKFYHLSTQFDFNGWF
jgi:hypothetical protein